MAGTSKIFRSVPPADGAGTDDGKFHRGDGTWADVADTTGNAASATYAKSLPQNAKTGAYTLLATDAGKSIPNTTGGWQIDASVHAAGDAGVVVNNSGSNQTFTAGTNVTFRLGGTATTGNRTIAQYSVANWYCLTGGANPVFIISGQGTT